MKIRKLMYSKILISAVIIKSTVSVASETVLEINAQNDVVVPRMKVTLTLDNVESGPADFFCNNVGGPRVSKDPNGDFLQFVDQRGQTYRYSNNSTSVTYTSEPSLEGRLESQRVTQGDVINAWGTISFTKRIIGNVLAENFNSNTLFLNRWRKQEPVKLFAIDKRDFNNAFFEPDNTGGSIHFFPLRALNKRIIGTTANDYEIISHETGHNISHILRPDRDLRRPQTGAIDESLGDFIAFSTAIYINPIRDRFLRETGGDLNKTSFLSETAESLGQAIGLGVHGIRNAFNNYKLGDTDSEVHDLSQVFTGALYDILVLAFEGETERSLVRSQKTRLNKINSDVLSVVLASHCLVPYQNPSFSDFGKTMLDIASRTPVYQYLASSIEQAFEERRIDLATQHHNVSHCDRDALNKYGLLGSKDSHVCGTHERLKAHYHH